MIPPCRHCGEPLQTPVRHCPFCGVSQQSESRPQLGPEPRITPPAPAPARQPAPPPPARRQPIVPPLSIQVPPPALPIRQRRPRRSGTGAVARLLLAALILAAAALLWHHLTATGSATLAIRLSRPVSGTLLIDDSPVSTPASTTIGAPGQPIPLAPGQHRIGFSARGWTTPVVTVLLANGESRSITLDPTPDRTTLSLDTAPSGASLSLDGRRLGHAPTSLALAPGTYRIGTALPGFLATQSLVTLSPGDHRTLTIALQPVPLRVLHLDAPAGAWSPPTILSTGSRFTVAFQGRIRVRIAGHVVLLDGGAPVSIGDADPSGLSFTAVGSATVPIALSVRN